MNDKKTKQVTILLLRGARSFFDAKKMKKKNFASLDFRDNPIYPISNPDGQDREVVYSQTSVNLITFSILDHF